MNIGIGNSQLMRKKISSILWNGDISSAVYLQLYNPPQDGYVRNLTLEDNDNRLYTTGYDNDKIYQYDLSVAGDITTATFIQDFSVSTEGGFPLSINFKPDGLSMYVINFTGTVYDLFQYNLTIAWDISSASLFTSTSFSGGNERDLSFNNDGTKLYTISAGSVDEYNVTTPWDISIINFVQSFNVTGKELAPAGLSFSTEGDYMYITGTNSDSVHQYSLSTSFNISTSIFVQSLYVGDKEPGVQVVKFDKDGNNMYILGFTNKTIYQYTL